MLTFSRKIVNIGDFIMSKINAFTLAEILITLSIIGVVAALTMPSLIQKHQEKNTVTALKKFYSTISQAYQMAVTENGTPDNWGFTTDDSEKLLTNIQPYMKFTKICTIGDTCHKGKITYKNGNKLGWSPFNPGSKERYAAIIPDGTIIGTYVQSNDCSAQYGNGKLLENVCGEYMADINGEKKPNTYGKDIFIFHITKYGIIPQGSQLYSENPAAFDGNYYDFKNGCLEGKWGFSCAAWVIYNENMDYFHCNDLEWGTKTKCK